MADMEAGGAAGKTKTETTSLIEANPEDENKAFARQYGKFMFLGIATVCIAAVVVVIYLRQKQQEGK